MHSFDGKADTSFLRNIVHSYNEKYNSEEKESIYYREELVYTYVQFRFNQLSYHLLRMNCFPLVLLFLSFSPRFLWINISCSGEAILGLQFGTTK